MVLTAKLPCSSVKTELIARLIVVIIELRVLASVRYLTSRKCADASEVTVTDRRTETGHTEQGHEIWPLLNYRNCGRRAFLFHTDRIQNCR